jgi:hypothetical protein
MLAATTHKVVLMTPKQLSRRHADISSSAKIDLIILDLNVPLNALPKAFTLSFDPVDPRRTVILTDKLELRDYEEIYRMVDIIKKRDARN